MDLKYNTEQEVNELQFNFVRSKLSSLIAYRKTDTSFFIKPLLFQGHKKQIEKILNSLSNG